MTENIQVDHVLDQKGLLCPMPIINTTKEISKLSQGQILKVTTTDPGSKPDFKAWARSTGNIIEAFDESEKTFTFHIRKA